MISLLDMQIYEVLVGVADLVELPSLVTLLDGLSSRGWRYDQKLEALLALTSVKYHGKLLVLIPLNQR